MWSKSVQDAKYCVLDTETTGLSPEQGDRLVEVAFLTSQGGKRLTSFHEVLNPEMHIPQKAVDMHGIDDAKAASCPKFADIADRLYAAMDGSVVVAHNASFDTHFIISEFQRIGHAVPNFVVLDTLRYSRKYLRLANYKLATVAAHFGYIEDGPWHNAFVDTKACEYIFYTFMKMFLAEGVSTVFSLQCLLED